MTDYSSFLENIWDQILSRDADKITSAFNSLDQASQETVISHLQLMISDEGWHPEQVKSAQAALSALDK